MPDLTRLVLAAVGMVGAAGLALRPSTARFVLEGAASPLVDAERVERLLLAHPSPYEPPTPWSYLFHPRRTVTEDMARAIVFLEGNDLTADTLSWDPWMRLTVRMTALLWAAVAWRSRTGSWPGTWDELAAAVPEPLALDPVSGESLRMRVVGERLQILALDDDVPAGAADDGWAGWVALAEAGG